MAALNNVLDPLINEVGDATDSEYLDYPQWSHVARAAQLAYARLNSNAQ